MADRQPRYPRGVPVAPSGKGPGGGRWRDDGKPNKPRPSWDEVASEVIGTRAAKRAARAVVPAKAAPTKAAPTKKASPPAAKKATKKASPPVARKAAKAAPTKAAPAKRTSPPLAKKAVPRTAAADRGALTAAALHAQWQTTQQVEGGGRKPKFKTTTDQAWIRVHGTDQVDIANTSYEGLPDDWQAENRSAGMLVADIVARHGGSVDLDDPQVRSAVGEEIHQAWLGRNDYARGGSLDVPFDDLPEDEQARDLDQVRVAMRALTPAPAKKAAPAKVAPTKATPRPQNMGGAEAIAAQGQRELPELARLHGGYYAGRVHRAIESGDEARIREELNNALIGDRGADTDTNDRAASEVLASLTDRQRGRVYQAYHANRSREGLYESVARHRAAEVVGRLGEEMEYDRMRETRSRQDNPSDAPGARRVEQGVSARNSAVAHARELISSRVPRGERVAQLADRLRDMDPEALGQIVGPDGRVAGATPTQANLIREALGLIDISPNPAGRAEAQDYAERISARIGRRRGGRG